MNQTKCSSLLAYFIGAIGSCLILGVLAYQMYAYTHPVALPELRTAERVKNLKELQDANTQALNNYDVIDAGKGVYRIPIARAIELSLTMGKNPAEARSNLIARVEKATAPAPKVPEKPSQFE
jgi:hypothetical protein